MAGNWNVPQPLDAAFLPPRGDDTAARQLVSLDDDLAPASSEGGGDDAVAVHVEEAEAASAGTPVGSFKARGPVSGWML